MYTSLDKISKPYKDFRILLMIQRILILPLTICNTLKIQGKPLITSRMRRMIVAIVLRRIHTVLETDNVASFLLVVAIE